MRYAVDADEVAGLSAVAAEVADALGAVDLGALVAALAEAMPGSDSAACLRVVDDLQVGLRTLLAALAAEGSRLRLAAEQYAAADRVVAAAARSAVGPSVQPPVGVPSR